MKKSENYPQALEKQKGKKGKEGVHKSMMYPLLFSLPTGKIRCVRQGEVYYLCVLTILVGAFSAFLRINHRHDTLGKTQESLTR